MAKNRTIAVSVLLMLMPVLLRCQKTDTLFDERDYQEISRNSEGEYKYVVTFKSKRDTNYTLKKYYYDSLYKSIAIKEFYHSNVLNGPYEFYSSNKLVEKGQYSNGLKEGKFVSYYPSSKIAEISYYSHSIRKGVWEFYSEEGILISKTYFINGKRTKLDKFDRSGKLIETISF
jgi:antitoxin component YwqK of YwqJK toxin-antitoxin module